MLAAMIGVPQLRGDPQVVAAALPGRDRPGQTGADLGLVPVVAGAIEVPVADSHRLFTRSATAGLAIFHRPMPTAGIAAPEAS